MQFILEIQTGGRAGQTVPVKAGRTLYVGRHETAHVVIDDDDQVADSHFALECDGKSCRLRDLGSRAGTLVNGSKSHQAQLKPGDKITAGNTTFLLRAEEIAAAPAAPSSAQPATTPAPAPVPAAKQPPPPVKEAPPPAPEPMTAPPASAIHRRVIDALRREPGPCYALLDAARDPGVLELLQASKDEHQSLYEGREGEQLASFAPYLVYLPSFSQFLETLVPKGWGQSWGVFLSCPLPLKDVRKHLRHFLMVKHPEGRDVYFRFYDPRVLRVFIPTLTPQESLEFFGPIKSYLMEAAQPDTLLRFSRSGQRLEQQSIALVETTRGRGF